MASSASFDVIVIGAGSAGFAAARTAADHGASVAIIEGAQKIGGLCILRGCMPSKALIESSRRWHQAGHAAEFGLSLKRLRPNPDRIMARKEQLIGEFADYRVHQLRDKRFTFLRGQASFEDPHHVEVAMENKVLCLEGRSFVIATGSAIASPPIPGLRQTGYLNSDDALQLKKLPKSLTVLGGGAIAVELAQHFARLGSRVSVIQRSPYLLKHFDNDVSQVLHEAFRQEKIDLYTDTQLLEVKSYQGKKRVRFRSKNKIATVISDEILEALGRIPRTESLRLEQAQVTTNGLTVNVTPAMQTSQPHIFAAGDVTGQYEVVHTAVLEGEVAGYNAARAAGRITGSPKQMDYRLKMEVIFTDPEIASVGLNEREAQEKKIPYFVASYPFSDHGKSMISGETLGFVKLIAEKKKGEILGAQIAGPHASDLIHELVAVMNYHGTAKELSALPHYHPTLSEILTYPAEEIANKIAPVAKRR